MDNLLAKIFLTVVGLGIAFWALSRWRKKKNLWLLLSVVVAILSAVAFWLGLANGIFLAFLAIALLFLGLWTKRGK
jgi:Na+/melibiose symporter-like transporter